MFNFISLVLASFFRSSFSMMNYPIHLGGFAGNTDLQRFAFDTPMNLVVTGITSDTELVNSAPSHFVMYALSSGTSWAWAKQLVNFPQDKVHAIEFGAADT
jgi:hypothetical protein